MHQNEGPLFLTDFSGLRKDGDSFYRAIIVSFLSYIFSNNTSAFCEFLFEKIQPTSFKNLTQKSKMFPPVSAEALKKHFIFRFRELIESNVNIASSPGDIASGIIDMVSRDDYFDAACILISRNLSLFAFQHIHNDP